MMLPTGRSHVGVGGEEAEHGEAESAENENEKSDDHAENEFTHEFLRTELLWQMERVGR